MLWGLVFCAVSCVLSVKSLEFSVPSLLKAQSDKARPWSWAWGSQSIVSIVDHSPVISYTSRPAAFGAEIKDPILGYVIPLSSFTTPCASNQVANLGPPQNTGCSPLCVVSPHKPIDTWIALVQRGGCEFVRKTREAQRLGAKAVIVGGDDPAISGYPDTLVNMYSPGKNDTFWMSIRHLTSSAEDASDVNIAATYIKFSDYMQLYRLIRTSNTTHSGLKTLGLLITAEHSAWEWYSPIITFIVILLLPSVLTLITLFIHRIRAARAAQRERAPQDVVRRLPWRVYTGNGWEKHEGEDLVDGMPAVRSLEVDLEEGMPSAEHTRSTEPHDRADALKNSSTPHPKESNNQPWFETQLECAICLSEFIKGDKVRVLPCLHIFHLSEVDEWLIQRKKLCPICKADVTQPPRPAPLGKASSSPSYSRDDLLHQQNATERTPLLHRNDVRDS